MRGLDASLSSSARILLDPRAILLSLTRDQTSPCNIPGYRPPRETMGLTRISVQWTNERPRGLAVNWSGTGERKLILAMKIPNLSRVVGGCSWEERWESSDEAGMPESTCLRRRTRPGLIPGYSRWLMVAKCSAKGLDDADSHIVLACTENSLPLQTNGNKEC